MKKKNVVYDARALKEYKKLSTQVRKRFSSYIYALEEYGYLQEPNGKKLSYGLYEIRVRYKGAWRCFYAYMKKDRIILLVFFRKKSNRTPIKEVLKALNRLRSY